MQKGERLPLASGSMSLYVTLASGNPNFSKTALSAAKRWNIMRRLIFLRFDGFGRLNSRHMMLSHSLDSIVA